MIKNKNIFVLVYKFYMFFFYYGIILDNSPLKSVYRK